MRALARRLLKLETRMVPPVDEAGMRLVELLRERERRWGIAQGRPHEELSDDSLYDTGSRPQTIIEVLQQRPLRRATGDNR